MRPYQTKSIVIERYEMARIRVASARALFPHKYTAILVGPEGQEQVEVNFRTFNQTKLAKDLDKIIDFGATSAAEVLNLQVRT